MAASLVAVRKGESYESARRYAEEGRQALGEQDDPILHSKRLEGLRGLPLDVMLILELHP